MIFFSHLLNSDSKRPAREGEMLYNIVPFFFFVFLITISFDSHPFSLTTHIKSLFLPSSTPESKRKRNLCCASCTGQQQHFTLPFDVNIIFKKELDFVFIYSISPSINIPFRAIKRLAGVCIDIFRRCATH